MQCIVCICIPGMTHYILNHTSDAPLTQKQSRNLVHTADTDYNMELCTFAFPSDSTSITVSLIPSSIGLLYVGLIFCTTIHFLFLNVFLEQKQNYRDLACVCAYLYHMKTRINMYDLSENRFFNNQFIFSTPPHQCFSKRQTAPLVVT